MQSTITGGCENGVSIHGIISGGGCSSYPMEEQPQDQETTGVIICQVISGGGNATAKKLIM